MDANRFDQVVRRLVTSGTRRRLLQSGAVLPLVGLVTMWLEGEEAAAKRKKKKRKRKKKNKKKGCIAESTAQTCAGKCATVANNCQQAVDCGPCACSPACPVCQTCDASSGQCVPNGALDGQACGQLGQVCTQGTCRCEAQRCLAAGGCCADAVCVPTDVQNDPAHCGSCQTPCAAGEACVAGACCAGLPPTVDLQAAIDLAAPGATVTLCPGTWKLDATVVVAKNLTLRGAGTAETILDGQNEVRVLRIAFGVTVTVQDLTIRRGNVAFAGSDNGGGGISNLGTLTLRGVAVTGNTAGSGGGISTAGPLTLEEGSRVSRNVTTGFGGGIMNGGPLTLKSGSHVSDNAAGDLGGGIFNAGFAVVLEPGSEVTGNSADEGGGIFNGPVGTVTVQADALVCDNQQSVGGQCAGTGTFTGDCPNPLGGVCPA